LKRRTEHGSQQTRLPVPTEYDAYSSRPPPKKFIAAIELWNSTTVPSLTRHSNMRPGHCASVSGRVGFATGVPRRMLYIAVRPHGAPPSFIFSLMRRPPRAVIRAPALAGAPGVAKRSTSLGARLLRAMIRAPLGAPGVAKRSTSSAGA
jgi:hypothetical protein